MSALEKIEARVKTVLHSLEALRKQQGSKGSTTTSMNPNAQIALGARVQSLQAELGFLQDVRATMLEESPRWTSAT